MRIHLGDWEFAVDPEATWEYTSKCSTDHCTCPYCMNFYENVDRVQPMLRPVLRKFGIYLDGPCEVMPFEPTLAAACYRVIGRIIKQGGTFLHVEDVPLRPETADEGTFFLWIGPLELPWTQSICCEDVESPANQPEFLDRMMQRLLIWAEQDDLHS